MLGREKVVVAGAGLMGTGIAHAFATSGFPTVLVDISAEATARARAEIENIIDGGIKLGKITLEDGDAAKSRLTTSNRVGDAAQGAALFVETVSEQLDIKLKVLGEAEPELADGAIIGTNTSALSVTQIASASAAPDRIFGMHFFNPVHKMKLVELVLGITTSQSTLGLARDYANAIGKTSIVVNEAPGLTTSRSSALLGNEAMFMLMEGTASAEDIDTAHKLGFNHPLGPLELGDMTGWDTRLAALRYMHQTLGEKFRPCPLIIKMVAAGRLGRKSGMGVYEYQDGQRVPGSGLKGSLL